MLIFGNKNSHKDTLCPDINNRLRLQTRLGVYAGITELSSMLGDKRKFLIEFVEFLDNFDTLYYGKCYFKMRSGQECQGWIGDVGETTFEYLDSGPMASNETYNFAIADIDSTSFAYWDEEVKRWVDYHVPDKLINRSRS